MKAKIKTFSQTKDQEEFITYRRSYGDKQSLGAEKNSTKRKCGSTESHEEFWKW